MPKRGDMLRACAHHNGAAPGVWRLTTGRRRWCCLLLSLVIALPGAKTLEAASPAQATSNRAARDEAVRSVPMDKLEGPLKQKIAATLNTASIYRRLPIQVTDCDPDLYLFLVRHPEVVVGIWEVMKISNVALERTGPDTFRASDGAGTLCQVKYCYSNHDTQVIYAEGTYDGPLFSRPIRASCVLVLKSGYMQETNGRYYVTSRMDTFIQIDHAGVELLAKTLQPLMNRSADYNFIETASFLGTVSRTAEINGAGVQRLAGKLANLEPHVRDRFAELALEVGKKAATREAAQSAAAEPLTASPMRTSFERR